jgi:hypothetical protein
MFNHFFSFAKNRFSASWDGDQLAPQGTNMPNLSLIIGAFKHSSCDNSVDSVALAKLHAISIELRVRREVSL